MWFSGLRGGVAFALASVSFMRHDFPQRCGGLPEGADCPFPADMTDSQGMLQTTMIIAMFTIFVFGGCITSVAIRLDVLAPKQEKDVVQELNKRMTSVTRASMAGQTWKAMLETVTNDTVGHDGQVKSSGQLELAKGSSDWRQYPSHDADHNHDAAGGDHSLLEYYSSGLAAAHGSPQGDDANGIPLSRTCPAPASASEPQYVDPFSHPFGVERAHTSHLMV